MNHASHTVLYRSAREYEHARFGRQAETFHSLTPTNSTLLPLLHLLFPLLSTILTPSCHNGVLGLERHIEVLIAGLDRERSLIWGLWQHQPGNLDLPAGLPLIPVVRYTVYDDADAL